MVDNVREYARTPTAEMQLVNINALMGEVLSLYGWDPEEQIAQNTLQKVNLQVSLQSDLPLVAGDPTQLRQVFHNLLSNAIDALSDTAQPRSEEHTSELQSRGHLVCRLLLEKKKKV